MSGLIEKLQCKIEKIHGGLNYHTISRFKRVVDTMFTICNEALTARAWQPYCSLAETTHRLLEAVRDTSTDSSTGSGVMYTTSPPPLTFKFYLPRGTDLSKYIAKELERAKDYLDRFTQLFDQACKDLQLNPWAIEGVSERGEKSSPFEGRFLVVRKNGVHLLDFKYKQEGESITGDATSLTQEPIPYLDAMVKQHTGILIEVGNTDKYPLEETVKPVLLNMYGSLFSDPD